MLLDVQRPDQWRFGGLLMKSDCVLRRLLKDKCRLFFRQTNPPQIGSEQERIKAVFSALVMQ
jgi:hypothetical protein